MSSSYSESDGSDSISSASDGSESHVDINVPKVSRASVKAYKLPEEESVQSSMDSECSHGCTIASSIPDEWSASTVNPFTETQASKTEDLAHPDSFDDLPSELITVIADYISETKPASFPPSTRRQPCPCGYVPARTPIKLPTDSANASLALSCASKRLREIVFDDRLDRAISVDFCEAAFRNLLFLNPNVRENVKRLSLHYDYNRCPPASRSNQNVSPCDLFEPWLFPNVDTFHINWLKSLTAYNVPIQIKAPTEDRSWPAIRHFSNVVDLHRHDEQKEVPMLFHHFNFPELRTFSFNLTTSWTFMKPTLAEIAGHIQDRKWAKLESGQLALKVPMQDMLLVADEMADEDAVWDALEIAAKGPNDDLFEDGVLVEAAGPPWKMRIHSNLIATEDRCDKLFRRLSDFHPTIKVLKLDVDAQIDHHKIGELRKMSSYQRMTAKDRKEDPIYPGRDLGVATWNTPQSFYTEYLEECGRLLSDDLVPYWKGQIAEEAEAPAFEASIPVNQSGQTRFHDLPPELIGDIVQHLSSTGPSQPFPPVELKQPCPCSKEGTDFRRPWLSLEDPILSQESTDPTLAWSCVSHKLRQIAFENRPERTCVIGFCKDALENLTFLPEAMRNHVTRLSMIYSKHDCPAATEDSALPSPWLLV